MRSQITQLYVDNGYITSGAFISNNQNVASGVVQIQVVEGELEGISILGLQRLQPGYVRSRIERLAGKPLNQKSLEQALQLLQLNPVIQRVNADPQTIASFGLGLNWQPFNGLVLRADYGIPLIGTSDRGSSLQENGFNFSVRYQPF